MQTIKIQRQGGKVVFNPAVQMVDIVTDGGSFKFENDDPNESHQPEPNSGGTWTCLIAFHGTSPLITADNPGAYPYHCKIHAQETGTVEAPNVITIQTELVQIGFNPAKQTITPSQDSGLFIFLNLDQTKSHRPQPDDPSNGTWFDRDIPPGQYSATKSITQPGTYNYRCAIHPAEAGTLTVSAPAASGGNLT